ncbi:MAG: hypothetical protein M1819_003005 [Sarea resinae]|nr:MAG: hypothetical protein M1819_003005 [Sarea resinae]
MQSEVSPPPLSLLLLPPPPSPPSFPALEAAYGPTLRVALSRVASAVEKSSQAAVLEIALPCPHLFRQLYAPRGRLYHRTQELVARIYKLICIICAKNAIDVDQIGGVDARILILAHGRDQTFSDDGERISPREVLQGPIIDLPTLAFSRRPWKRIYAAESEQGEKILRSFLSLTRRVPGRKGLGMSVERVRGGTGMVSQSDQLPTDGTESSNGHQKHLSVAVGGTFDHLHAGHKLLLTMTAFMLEPSFSSEGVGPERRVIVGITGDELLKNKKFAQYLESWEERKAAATEFLASVIEFLPSEEQSPHVERLSGEGPNGNVVKTSLSRNLVVECVELSDPFGPTITDPSISALVVSGETRSGGKAINDKRGGKGWQDLEVLEVDVLDAEDESTGAESGTTSFADNYQSKISSTGIRQRMSEKGAAITENGQ